MKNEATELKNAFDSMLNEKATEVAKDSADALEAKANELTSMVEKSNEELKAQNEILQKQMDEIKNQAPAIVKSVGAKNEITEKLMEMKSHNWKNGDKFTLELKDWGNNADGQASAPYGDERVSNIKYNPNFKQHVAEKLMGGSTSGSGAIRHTFETSNNSGDNTANKVQGTVATQSSITLTDVHTPIRTIFNVLTLPQEQLDDISMVESFLSTRLMGNLKDHEDRQLLRGTGLQQQYTGLAAGARDFADAAARASYVGDIADLFSASAGANVYDVLTAVAAGMANENYTAGVAFLNPIDYYSMVLDKTSDGRYALQTTISPSGEYKTIWNGIEIVKTAAQIAGTFTVIDPMATQYWVRDGASIEFGMNDDDFASNNITVRASIRGALTNYNQLGIVSDTFSNFFTALNA